jgi:hypothetical protein
VYLAGFVLCAATVWPAADITREIGHPFEDVTSLGHLLKTGLRFVGIGLAPVRATPLAWQFLLYPPENAELTALWPWLGAVAVTLAGLVVIFRDEKALLMVCALTILGATLFGHLVYAIGARHWGIVTTCFLTCLWLARSRGHARGPIVAAMLALGTVAGAEALVLQWAMPFSMAGATARWIAASPYASLPIIGVPDSHATSVTALLDRDLTMPNCHCTGHRVVFSRARDGFRRADLPAALAEEVTAPALLVSSWNLGADETAAIRGQGIEITLLTAQTGSWTDDIYWVYRLSR